MSDEWDLEHELSAELPEGVDIDDDIDLDDASVAQSPAEHMEPMGDGSDFDEFAPDELSGDAPE